MPAVSIRCPTSSASSPATTSVEPRYLKIDIEFVRGLIGSIANQHVVKAIVNLAQGFGCETIAEGVEDERTLQMLEGLGVDYAQGFHLGRPAPLSEAPSP